MVRNRIQTEKTKLNLNTQFDDVIRKTAITTKGILDFTAVRFNLIIL